MAVLQLKYPTLLDMARRKDPDGKPAVIAEILNETNGILDDMVFKEANDGHTEKTTVRTGLPSATWRKLNYGVANSKSQTAQISDSCGMLEAYAEIDKALADMNGNTAEFRMSEDRSFLESMNQMMATTLFYGDTDTNPERFNGIAPRFNLSTAPSGANLIDAGGDDAAANTSIYFASWGPLTGYGIVPKGSVAGFQHRDLGEQTLEDAAGGKFQGYRTHYKWDLGLTVRDWKHWGRICDIKTSALTKSGSTGADLVDLMIQMVERLPEANLGKRVIYANQTVLSYLRRQITNKSNVRLSLEEVAGKKVVHFDGIPVRRVDKIVNTEALVA